MSKDIKSKVEPKKKDAKISSADDMIKTSKKGDIELDEEELKRVSGGTAWEDITLNSRGGMAKI